jgi:hypothetical protein
MGEELAKYFRPRKRTSRPGHKILFNVAHISSKLKAIVSNTTPRADTDDVIDFVTNDRGKANLEKALIVASGKPQLRAGTVPEVTTKSISPLVADTIVGVIVVVKVILGLFFGSSSLGVYSEREGTEQKEEKRLL